MLRRTAIAAAASGLLVLAAPAATPAGGQTTSYVALGDSYAAGPLIPMHLSESGGCFRSDHNYPHLVAAALRVAELRDASCAGASTKDMTSPQNVNPGPPNPPQLDRLDSGTQLVTIEVGGNDIGFTEIVQACATADRSGTPCQDRFVHGSDDEIRQRIKDAAPKIESVLNGIHKQAPQARVFFVNYLSILPESGSGCWPQVPFADADVPYLRAKQHELNGMLADQAAANKATLVDAFAASVGHDACQPAGVRWIEPVLGASGAPPVHPNSLGMECTAVAVLAVVAPGTAADPTLCAPPAVAAVVATPGFTG